MTRFKETYRVVSEEYETEEEAYAAYSLIESLTKVSVHIKQASVPVVQWNSLDDGYGVVGYSWDCFKCDTEHSFVRPFKGDTYRCSKCHTEHYSDWEDK